jgi:excinuclease ABC subunit C
MKKDILPKKIPNTPGVYFFLGRNRKVLYIGKATSLKNRIRSYFDRNIREKRSAVIEKMIGEAKNVEWTPTDSVLEAMLLETNLIRTQRPEFNTRSKDDKSFNHVAITKEKFPRILIVRGKEISEIGDKDYLAVYGPYPAGSLFKEALKILRRLFQYYDKDASEINARNTHTSKIRKGKLDFNKQIGLYPERTDPKEYKKTIRHIMLFFEGKKEKLIAELRKEMLKNASKELFEEANAIKRKIFALEHIQDVSLIRDESRVYVDDRTLRIESYDVAHMHGDNMVGTMVVTDANKNALKSEYRKFSIRGFDSSNDTGALAETLNRRLKHTEWGKPDLVVVDGGVAQKNIANKVLKKHQIIVPVVSVVKDEKHKPKKILGVKKYIEKYKEAILFANFEAHRFAINYHRDKRRKQFTG